MSIPEAGCPHMTVCLEDRRHADGTVLYDWQNIESELVVECNFRTIMI